MEILVAMGVFTLLGFGAMAFLLAGLRSWRLAEGRRDAAERAEFIFTFLRNDLACLWGEPAKAADRVVLVSDYDAGGRQRLFFSRSVPPAGADPRIALGGRRVLAKDPLDGVQDLAALKTGRLGPPGDCFTVAYFTDGEENLYRAARSPAVLWQQVLSGWHHAGGQKIAERVMHIEFNFWARDTQGWTPTPQRKGPRYGWDSTGILLKNPQSGKRKRPIRRQSRDRFIAFPRMIEVKVVLAPSTAQNAAYLSEDISPHETVLRVEGAEHLPDGPGEFFVKLNKEWVSYRVKASGGRALAQVTRSRRNTRAQSHAAGTVLRRGISFRSVFRAPCQYEAYWNYESEELSR